MPEGRPSNFLSMVRRTLPIKTLRSAARVQREASSLPPSPIYVPSTGPLLYSLPSSPQDPAHTIPPPGLAHRRCISQPTSKFFLGTKPTEPQTSELVKREVQPQKHTLLPSTRVRVSGKTVLRSDLRRPTTDGVVSKGFLGLSNAQRMKALKGHRGEGCPQRPKYTLVAVVKDTSCYPAKTTTTVFRISGDYGEVTEALVDTGRKRWVNVKGVGNTSNQAQSQSRSGRRVKPESRLAENSDVPRDRSSSLPTIITPAPPPPSRLNRSRSSKRQVYPPFSRTRLRPISSPLAAPPLCLGREFHLPVVEKSCVVI